jgi:cytochrome P450
MTDTKVSELDGFPRRGENPFAAEPPYPELDPAEPISRITMPTGDVIWLVTSHEYVRQILNDPRVTADRGHPGYPVSLGFPNRRMMQETTRRMPALLGMDPPDHTVRRRMIGPAFSGKRSKEMRPRIVEIVDECVDDMLASGRPVDLVEKLAIRVPTQVICDILGVPYEDRDFIHRHTRTVSTRGGSDEAKRAAMMELNQYLEKLVIQNEENPGDDLIGQLVRKFRDADMYTRTEMVGTVLVLLHGGKNGAANMIALGVVALLEYPEQLELLKNDPSLAPVAVEELLRYFSPSAEGACYRAALEDIEIGGVTIKAGEGLLAFGSTGSRDGRVFPEPDLLDIRREGAHEHLAFGYGPHQCIGQHVARVELEVVFTRLFERIPDLRLAVPADELPYMHDYSTFGIWEVPVTWG